MTQWHGSGIHSNIRRFFCWLYGCDFREEIGGGWCQNCGADHETYQGPAWRRELFGEKEKP